MIWVINKGIEYDLLESRALWSRVRGYTSVRRGDIFASSLVLIATCVFFVFPEDFWFARVSVAQ